MVPMPSPASFWLESKTPVAPPTSANPTVRRLVYAGVVTGAWSGVITKGDTSRVTGADGLATFYSARSRTAGTVEFCVIDIAQADSDYKPDAGKECHSIEK